MAESSFVCLQEIGSLVISNEEIIRFSVDSYHGFRYLSIRRYLQTSGFSGATRDGVTLTPEILHALTPRILALDNEVKNNHAGPLGKFAKRPGICIVAEVGLFKGNMGLGLRQDEANARNTGKKIWISLEFLPAIKELFKKSCERFTDIISDDF